MSRVLVTGPHTPVQGGVLSIGQLQGEQPSGGEQRQTGQCLSVDAVALGMFGTRTAAGRRTWRLRHEKRCGREKRRTPPPAARQARSVPGPPPTPSRAERQRWPHPRFESGWPPWVHTACGTPVVRSRPIPAPYASWRSLGRYQPVVVPFIPPPLSGHRATAPADRVSNAHDHGSQGGKSSLTTAPTHVLQTSPASDGPAHFPHPGHPWPANIYSGASRG